jgi:O-antigen ligase
LVPESRIAKLAYGLSLGLVVLAFLGTQALIGGVKVVFSAPSYAVLAIAALMLVGAQKNLAAFRPSCLVAALCLAVWVVARSLSSPVTYLARNDLLMILGALIVYLGTAVWFTNPRARLTIIGLLLLGALSHAAIGAIQFKQDDNFMLIPWLQRPDYGWRASGFYVCPNHLAGLLEVVGMMTLGIACWSNKRPLFRVGAAYGAVMCLAGVAITGSRGGYLSVLFGLGIFALLSLWVSFRLRRGGFWTMFSVILVGGAVIVGGALFFMTRSATLHTRLSQIYDPTNMRPLMWQAALTQFRLEPWTGTGSGTYLYYGRLFRSASVQNDPMHVHNDYLELLAEYGVIGAFLFAVFALLHVVGGMAGLRRIVDEQIPPRAPALSDELALLIGAFSGIGALVMHSVVDFNLHIPANALIVAFLFGILARPIHALAETGVRVPWVRWLVPALGVALLSLCIRYFPGEYFAEKARVALREDRHDEAVAFAERGLQYEKKNPNLYGYLGGAKHFLTRDEADYAIRRKLHEEAVEAYRTGLQLFPRDTGLLLKLAQTYSLLERFQEADEVFHRVFECDPNFGLAYAYYGLHWELQRRIRTAERYFRKASNMGETDISPKGLHRIEQLKKSPVGQALMSAFPEADYDPLLDAPPPPQ